MSAGPRPYDELRDLAVRGETGEFVCATSGIEIHVYVQRGRIAWATCSTRPFEFARRIKEHGRVDDDSFRHVVEECRRERLPLGATLVKWGLASWEEIRSALRQQIGIALAALAELPEGSRTLFLERKRFTEYDEALTLDLAAVTGCPGPESRRARRDADRPSTRGFARQLFEAIDDGLWVELIESGTVIDAAPAPSERARVPASLLRCTLDDDCDLVGIRSARGSIVGARVAHGSKPRSVWCKLAADSTFGAAMSTLWSLKVLTSVADPRGDAPEATAPSWAVGDSTSAAAGEIQMILARAPEVVGAAVLSETGEPIVGAGRDTAKGVPSCIDLFRRRARLFAVPMFDDDPGDGGATPMDSVGFNLRTAVTGERDAWCFGAELIAVGESTLWMLTDRRMVQGVGWACLTALTRGISRASAPRRREAP